MNKIISYRMKFTNAFKKAGIKYNYDVLCNQGYCGEGFYINHRKKVLLRQKIWGVDKHGAYGGALKNNKFPISSRIGLKQTELGIYVISFKDDLKPRYKDFYYTLYKNNCILTSDGKKTLILTNLDLEIFKDLYKNKFKIEFVEWFQDIDYLPVKDIVDEMYKDKKSAMYEKPIFEAGWYGCFARDYLKLAIKYSKKYGDNSRKFRRALKKLKEVYRALKLNLTDAVLNEMLKYALKENTTVMEQLASKFNYKMQTYRDEHVVIAMFQTAYLRYDEWQQFKKNIDSVVYMNTDSVYCDKPFDVEVGPNIGDYDWEYNGEMFEFIRRNGYAVLSDDCKEIKKIVLGGILTQEESGLNIKKLDYLYDGHSVLANTKDEDGNITPIFLEPTFQRMNYNLEWDKK